MRSDMDEDLLSPPYPGPGATADLVYALLGELRSWVLHYRDKVNSQIGRAEVPVPRELPRASTYSAQPIIEQFRHFMIMRQIREQWDTLIREFEESWDSKPAFRGRVMLLQAASVTVNEAFVPREVREARSVKHMDHIQKAFDSVGRLFEAFTEPGGSDEWKIEKRKPKGPLR